MNGFPSTMAVHMVMQQAEADNTTGFEDLDTVNLSVIMKHH